jgi:hypothetical protein
MNRSLSGRAYRLLAQFVKEAAENCVRRKNIDRKIIVLDLFSIAGASQLYHRTVEMPHYQFMYGDRENETRIQKWIVAKIDATIRKNTGWSSKISRTALERLQDLNISEFDIYPNRFVIYSTGVDAMVAFDLNQTTGTISVSFSDSYGGKGGNPWWCLAIQRPESRTCSKIATADAPYDISILEYIRDNILVQTGPTRGMTRRPRSGSRSVSGSRSGSSNRSTRRRSKNRH